MAKIDYEKQRLALREALKQARKAAGLTQAEVAAKLGKPQSFVAKYENGERRLEAVELVDLMKVLQMSQKAIWEALDL